MQTTSQDDTSVDIRPTKEELYRMLWRAYVTRDKDLLWDWVWDVFRIKIPRKVVVEGHCSPFDYFSDLFFRVESKILGVGNRTGGKTLMFAMACSMWMYLLDYFEATVAASIEPQAIRCYNYFKEFNEDVDIFADNVLESLQSRTSGKNKSKIEVITATMKGVNSPHPQTGLFDEVDLMLWPILQEGMSMPQSKHDIPAQLVVTSTRKFSNGPMQRLVKESKKRGFKTYIWSIWETLEPHDPVKCQESGFSEVCKGRCEELEGWYSFDDAVDKWRSMDPDVWDAQWECKSPERGGLVYPQYEDDYYPRGNLYKHTYDPSLETYILEDFGSGPDHPNVNLFVQIDWRVRPLPRFYVFDEIYLEYAVTSREVIGHVSDKLEDTHKLPMNFELVAGIPTYDFSFLSGWIHDPSGLTEAKERRMAGAPVMGKVKYPELYKVRSGISLLRVLIRNKQFLVHPRCARLREELTSYSKKLLPDGTWSEEPQKKDDHGPDAARYGAIRLMPLEGLKAIGVPDPKEDEGAKFTTPARSARIRRNNRL